MNVTLEEAAFEKDTWNQYFKDLNPDDYQDEFLRRQVEDLIVLGNAALDEDRLSELTTTVNTMTNIYSTARICPYKEQDCDLDTAGLTLEPGIETIIAQSLDYDELSYAWALWRDVSGRQMKTLYPVYVNLSNQAAQANGESLNFHYIVSFLFFSYVFCCHKFTYFQVFFYNFSQSFPCFMTRN